MSESSNFSKNLIEETIKCFKEEDGLDLSPEQAIEYLHSMAGLFLARRAPTRYAELRAALRLT